MYNLLVAGNGWTQGRNTFPADRVFEHTSEQLVQRFKPNNVLDADAVLALPTLFMAETRSPGGQIARVGTVSRIQEGGRGYVFECIYDTSIPGIPNETLEELSGELGIDDWEFSRTHWAIKDVDLFRVLLNSKATRRPVPKVFQLSEQPVRHDLVAVMMPFEAGFAGVYAAIERGTREAGKECRRADDMWRHDAVVQDVVELICVSRVVVCDLSGRNANVFYEAGIAHALGKDVILIAQSSNDVPFNLQHLRHIPYVNDDQGLEQLANRLRDRIKMLERER